MAHRKLTTVTLAASALVLGAGAEGAPRAVFQAAPAPVAKPTFVVKGRGWGHGVGMSQYGALGMAKQGTTFDQILAHYYPGTTLGPAPLSKVRVLLAEGQTKLTLSSESTFKVRDGAGTVHILPAGTYTVGPNLTMKVAADLPAQRLVSPLLFTPTAFPLNLGRPYRGQIQVISQLGKLQAINFVGLENYLQGVVPSEVPTGWPMEALRSQAVVARSYALSHRKIGGAFDMYADTRSQVYLGVQEEEAATNQAVNTTAGKVLLYRGVVAKTYYHSTSGGRTASITDAWPGSQPVPYLVSVQDPADSLSPYHHWGPYVVSGVKIMAALKARGQLLDLTTTPNSSGRAATVTALTTLGSWTGYAADVRTALGLRSTWFTIGALALARPVKPVVFGGKLVLTGTSRGVGKTTLEERAAGVPWRALRTVASSAGGKFSIRLAPRATTYYRLSAGEARSGAVRVPVTPLVRMKQTLGGTGFTGTVRPLLPGARVEVQQLAGVSWRTVASTTVNEVGTFEVALLLEPGSYRARVTGARGLAAGLSAVLAVYV